jgi:hypothetical protein
MGLSFLLSGTMSFPKPPESAQNKKNTFSAILVVYEIFSQYKTACVSSRRQN